MLNYVQIESKRFSFVLQRFSQTDLIFDYIASPVRRQLTIVSIDGTCQYKSLLLFSGSVFINRIAPS